jgi:hypothetical protein
MMGSGSFCLPPAYLRTSSSLFFVLFGTRHCTRPPLIPVFRSLSDVSYPVESYGVSGCADGDVRVCCTVLIWARWLSIVDCNLEFLLCTYNEPEAGDGCRGCHQGFSSCPNPTVDLDACLFVYMLTYDPLHTELSQPRQSPLNPSSNETHPCDSINQVFATQTDTIPNNSLPLSVCPNPKRSRQMVCLAARQ